MSAPTVPPRRQWFVRAAIVSLLLASCTGGSGDDAASLSSEATATVDVWVSGDPEETQAFIDVADAYNASQEAIDVEVTVIAERDDLIARLSTAFAGGEPPDLFLMNYRYLGQFDEKGSLQPVQPFLDASRVLSAEDFYPEAMEVFTDDAGQQVCLPQNVSSLVTYYNRDLFEEAGVPLPKEGWTWSDLGRRAAALTDAEAGIHGMGVDPEVIRIAPFIWSNGGELVDGPFAPTGFTLDTGTAIQPLQAFLDLRGIQEVTPTDEEVESADLETRFLDGTLAMMMESRKVVPSYRTITEFEWDVAPLPVWREPATILHSDAYCMTAGGEQQDQAWAFMEFALGEEGQRIAAETGRTVPSLRSVARSDAFLDPSAAPANSQVFLDAIPTIQAVPPISTWPEIEDVTNALLEEAYYEPGGGEAGEVAAAIIDQTAPLFARAQEP